MVSFIWFQLPQNLTYQLLLQIAILNGHFKWQRSKQIKDLRKLFPSKLIQHQPQSYYTRTSKISRKKLPSTGWVTLLCATTSAKDQNSPATKTALYREILHGNISVMPNLPEFFKFISTTLHYEYLKYPNSSPVT